ncbi:hypothetical protein SAMN04487965_2093 [Microbulbifer donghaiensis]|uniref:Entericidin EcnA/B family protein n=2 Tax=Microbulbifer donghaiensis TaxID=494016 RepID=A0A1M5C7S8_9GAMM|nr:hypothetical protein SAMN04487965_2093 [Microbulbifer donghaiensis]
MTNNWKKIVFGLLCLCFVSACAEFKSSGRAIGHAAKDITKSVGHGVRDTAKAVGRDTKKLMADDNGKDGQGNK